MESHEISKEDQSFIDAGTTDLERVLRKTIIERALEINGAMETAQPGMAVSYISRENYARIVVVDGLPPNVAAVLEQALNWEALGRGKGGLAGAAVRFNLRTLFVPEREAILIDKFDPGWSALLKDYTEFSSNNKHFFATWFANAWNVLGLATSSFIRECHHWNAQNTRPIKALCGSLNMEMELPESEYRKAFYLSIHPVPLIYLTAAYLKSREKDDKDISETVRQRLNVPPAGYADFCACGVAAQAFLTEKYAGHSALLNDIRAVHTLTNTLRADPLAYNQFAVQLGVAKKSFDKSRYTEAMIVLAAYAKSQIGGTLSKSPALCKFIDAHSRKVNKFVDAFDYYAQKKSDDLFGLITGRSVMSLEDLPDKLKPLMKVQTQISEMNNLEMTAAVSDLISKRFSRLLAETEEFSPKPVETNHDREILHDMQLEDENLINFMKSGTKDISFSSRPKIPQTPVVVVKKPDA